MSGSSHKTKYHKVRTQVDREIGARGIWARTREFFGSNTFSDRRKASIDKHYGALIDRSVIAARQSEVRALQAGSSVPVAGKPQADRALSTGAEKAMPYATGLLAQSRSEGAPDLQDMTFKHLGVGSQAMEEARQKMNRGRGNVDANDPAFPEAHYRTGVGYATWSNDTATFAATAELLRAGNCDMHAATTFTYAGAHMDEQGIAAKVVHPGHTFSELRGKNGATQVSPKDVIVDSWAGGDHAVLREDSYFATAISASKDRVAHPDHTEATVTRDAGQVNYARQRQVVNTHQLFQQYHDAQALLPANRVDPANPVTDGMWRETPIISDTGKLQASQRGYTFRKGSTMLQDLQKVAVARKMGASIGGATAYANKTRGKR